MAPGERSEEVWLWYTAVYEAIQEIPQGRCTSYGHIARLVGKRESAILRQRPLTDMFLAMQLSVPGNTVRILSATRLTHDVKDKLESVSKTCHRRQPIAARRVPRFIVAMCLGSA